MAEIPGQVEPIIIDAASRLVAPLWYEFFLFVYRSLFGSWKTNFQPVMSAAAGGPPIGTATCRYRRVGHTVNIFYDITITNTNGGSSALNVTLPIPAAVPFMLVGREVATNGSTVTGTYAGSMVSVLYYNNSTVIATNNRIWLSGTYEI
jgi:hypothetical protein